MEGEKPDEEPKVEEAAPQESAEQAAADAAPESTTPVEQPAQEEPKPEEAKAEAPAPEKLKQEEKQDEPIKTEVINKPETPAKVEEPNLKEEVKNSSQQQLHVNTSKKNMDDSKDNDRDDFDHEEGNANWHEYRIVGKAPTRRAYHASFVYNNYFYVHGGHDIREGTLEKMYKINLNPKTVENSWELIQARGIEKPGKIGFHTLTRYENKAYLIGGSDLGIDNDKMYEFSIETSEWRVIRPLGSEKPPNLDEHSASLWNDVIVVFGGNVNGFKTSDTWLYSIPENKWSKIEAGSTIPERSNHGAAILGDKLYVFGGKDTNNNKLNDFWVLDLGSKSWTQLEQKGDHPLERSG